MLNMIYEALDVSLLVLSIIIVLILMKRHDSILSIKIRIIMTLMISIIFFLQIILGIILKKSVFNDIICLGLWIFSTKMGFSTLKESRIKSNCLETGTDTEEITEVLTVKITNKRK